MGKFKPIKFGASIGVFGFIVVLIVGFAIFDEGLALQFAPPELRVVGGCFRDCLDEEQTGFGGQDPAVEDEMVDIVVTDDEGNTTTVDGIKDGHSGVVTPIDENGDETTLEELIPDLEETDDVSVVLPSGAEHTLLEIEDSVACWMNVRADVIDGDGFILARENSGFLMANPVPQLSLTDQKTGFAFDAGIYQLFPAIKCTTNDTGGLSETDESLFDDNIFTYPSFDSPMKLESTEIQFRVYSVFEDQLIETYNAPITIPEKEITNPQSIDLGEHTITTENLLKFLPEGDYNSFQHIALEGDLVVHWNTGIAEVDNVPQIVKLKTVKTFTEGKLTKVENPVMIYRELVVSKDDGGTEPPKIQECMEGEVPLNDDSRVCIKIGSDGCGDNAVLINGACVNINKNPQPDPKVNNIIDRLTTCIQSGDPNCLLSSEFLPFWLVGVGIIVVAIGAGQRATKQPDIYGVPRGY